MSFKLGCPPDPKDPRFFQWINLLWKYLQQLSLTSSTFANSGTTTTVLHGNENGNPSFGPVNLATDVTGFLSEANAPPQDNVGSIIYMHANLGGF